MMDHRGRPLAASGPGDPGARIQPLHALSDRQSLLDNPGIELAHHVGLGFIDDEPGGNDIAPGFVSVSIRSFGADDVAISGLLELAAPKPLGQHRALVLGDGPWIWSRS
jgi:hypothetical protein